MEPSRPESSTATVSPAWEPGQPARYATSHGRLACQRGRRGACDVAAGAERTRKRRARGPGLQGARQVREGGTRARIGQMRDLYQNTPWAARWTALPGVAWWADAAYIGCDDRPIDTLHYRKTPRSPSPPEPGPKQTHLSSRTAAHRKPNAKRGRPALVGEDGLPVQGAFLCAVSLHYHCPCQSAHFPSIIPPPPRDRRPCGPRDPEGLLRNTSGLLFHSLVLFGRGKRKKKKTVAWGSFYQNEPTSCTPRHAQTPRGSPGCRGFRVFARARVHASRLVGAAVEGRASADPCRHRPMASGSFIAAAAPLLLR